MFFLTYFCLAVFIALLLTGLKLAQQKGKERAFTVAAATGSALVFGAILVFAWSTSVQIGIEVTVGLLIMLILIPAVLAVMKRLQNS